MTRVDVRSAALPARSPWVAVAAGIAGLALGYTLVVGPHAASAENVAKCPCEDGQCGAKGNS